MNREEGHDQQRGRTKKKIMVSHVKPDKSWLAVRPSSSPERAGGDFPGQYVALAGGPGPSGTVFWAW